MYIFYCYKNTLFTIVVILSFQINEYTRLWFSNFFPNLLSLFSTYSLIKFGKSILPSYLLGIVFPRILSWQLINLPLYSLSNFAKMFHHTSLLIYLDFCFNTNLIHQLIFSLKTFFLLSNNEYQVNENMYW